MNIFVGVTEINQRQYYTALMLTQNRVIYIPLYPPTVIFRFLKTDEALCQHECFPELNKRVQI